MADALTFLSFTMEMGFLWENMVLLWEKLRFRYVYMSNVAANKKYVICITKMEKTGL
jgi:hypothetical protein